MRSSRVFAQSAVLILFPRMVSFTVWEIEGEFAQQREVPGCMTHARPALVFIEGRVQRIQPVILRECRSMITAKALDPVTEYPAAT